MQEEQQNVSSYRALIKLGDAQRRKGTKGKRKIQKSKEQRESKTRSNNSRCTASPNEVLAVAAIRGLLEEPHRESVTIDHLQALPLHGALAQAILHVVDNVGLASDF